MHMRLIDYVVVYGLLAAIPLAVVAAAAWAIADTVRRDRTLRRLAGQWEGVYLSGLLTYPSVEGVVDGVPARLSFPKERRERQPHATRVSFEWPPPGALSVSSRHGAPAVLRTGDGAFDAAFVVQAAPAEWALAALDAEVRAHLLALQRTAWSVRLDVGTSGLTVECDSNLGYDAERLGRFVNESTAILRRLRGLRRGVTTGH